MDRGALSWMKISSQISQIREIYTDWFCGRSGSDFTDHSPLTTVFEGFAHERRRTLRQAQDDATRNENFSHESHEFFLSAPRVPRKRTAA